MTGLSYFHTMRAHHRQQPIGIFDSGIGGLTVAKAIHDLLPQEQLLYFGDTAHLPYGDKSPEAILQYADAITAFMLKNNCKMVVIACNTASAIAHKKLIAAYGERVPVLDVIDPVVKATLAQPRHQRIGVIGTKATIRSNTYEKKIHALNPAVQVSSLATPLLVPMIEEGYFDNKISHTIIEAYLNYPDFQQIDALILGCTHYPLIKPAIASHYHHKVPVMDSTTVVAEAVHQTLQSLDLLSGQKIDRHRFLVSDYTRSFEQTARMFFQESIHLEHYPIWEQERNH